MKAFEFVSGNLCHMSKRHAQRIMDKKKPPPIIIPTDNQIVEFVLNKFVQISAKCRNPRMHIAFTVGVDATVLVKSWQVYAGTHVVGGAHPNHFLNIDDTCSI